VIEVIAWLKKRGDMWSCGNCGEQSEAHFEVCWNCQYSKEGVPHIRPEDVVEDAQTILESYLQPNEFLRYWAHGLKLMSIETRLCLFLLGILFAVAMLVSIQAVFLPGLDELNRPIEIGWDNKIPTIVLVVTVATIFYLVANNLATKNYIIGLTSHRFIALLCENKLQVKEILEYRLSNLPLIKTKTELQKAMIEIGDPQKPLFAIFHQADLFTNFRQAEAIANILSTIESKQASSPQAESYCPQCKAEYRAGVAQCNRCRMGLIKFRSFD
jgi:hypothetical protein